VGRVNQEPCQRPSAAQPIGIRRAGKEDRQRWDDYVLNRPDASAYHLFAWKLAIEEAYGHSCPYLYAECNGQWVGVLPMVHLRLPGVVNELVALPYCDVGSCLVDSDRVEDALLEAALSLQKNLGSKQLQLRGPLAATGLQNTKFQAEVTGKVRMLLDLPPSADELMAGFKSKLRSQIRKAEKNGVTFCWAGMDDLDELYTVFSRNMHELGSPVHGKAWLKNVMIHYADRARVGVARFETKTVGMGIILAGGTSVSIPWASTLRDYNHLGINMLLYWNFLQFSADHGYKIFDFGRSTAEEGTYRFKKQWGAEPWPLPWYLHSAPHRGGESSSQFSGGRDVLAEVWRKMPLSVANTLGPLIRKYISL